MKFIFIVLLIIFNISYTIEYKILKTINKSKRIENLYYFATACFYAVENKQYKHPDELNQTIRSCFPLSWSTDKALVDEKDSKNFLKEGKNIFKEFMDVEYKFKYLYKDYNYKIDEVVNKLCANKEKTIDVLGGKRRMFIEDNKKDKSKKDDKKDKSKDKNEKSKDKKDNKNDNSTKKPEEATKEDPLIKHVMKITNTDLKPILLKIKDYMINLFSKNVAAKKQIESLDCIKNKYDENLIKKFDSNLKLDPKVKVNIETALNKLKLLITRGWSEYVQIIMDSICNWDMFKASINSLLGAYEKKIEESKIWIGVGTFVGKLLSSMTGVFKEQNTTSVSKGKEGKDTKKSKDDKKDKKGKKDGKQIDKKEKDSKAKSAN